jgi:hypothetical protein
LVLLGVPAVAPLLVEMAGELVGLLLSRLRNTKGVVER